MTKKNTILIVDDIRSNLILLDKILSDEGYDVISSTNGDDAIKCAQESELDLILLDIMMPKKDGFTVFKELKLDAKTANIPVIFITVINNDKDTLKAFEMGVADYISKPYTPTELRIRVKTQIELVNARKNSIANAGISKYSSLESEQNSLNVLNEKLIFIKNHLHNLKQTQFNTKEQTNITQLKTQAEDIVLLLKALSK